MGFPGQIYSPGSPDPFLRSSFALEAAAGSQLGHPLAAGHPAALAQTPKNCPDPAPMGQEPPPPQPGPKAEQMFPSPTKP